MDNNSDFKIPYNPLTGFFFILLGGINGVRLGMKSGLAGLYIFMIVASLVLAIMHFAVPFFKKVGNMVYITNNYFGTQKVNLDNITSVDTSNSKRLTIQTTDNSIPVTVLIRMASPANRKRILKLLNDHATENTGVI